MLDVILWDVDGTLLDFSKSERCGLEAGLREIGFHRYDDAMLKRYAQINRRYWEALERGEISKTEVLVGRFRDFFRQEGIPCADVEAFNAAYQRRLGENFFENEDSVALCRRLHERVRQYVVTNGTVEAQRAKLEGSGLGACMDGVFISDEIGVEKPGAGFFDYVFRQIGAVERSRVMIVGDSLTSDILGGNRAGILCCWYNPRGLENTAGVRVDYEIRRLQEVERLCAEIA